MSPPQAQKIILVGLVFIFAIENDLITRLVNVTQAAFTNVPTALPGDTINTIFGSISGTAPATGANTQPGTISPVGTQCKAPCIFVPIGGGTTGVCWDPVNQTQC